MEESNISSSIASTPPSPFSNNLRQTIQCDNITISNNNIVYIRKKKLRLLLCNLDKIYVFFAVKLIDIQNHDECRNSEFLSYHVFCENNETELSEVTKRVQHYIDSLNDAEDSSYDSDCDTDDQFSHQNVSRTVSDTLGQEFSEYLGQPIVQDKSPGYIQRVEFALKLGYTECLVQAALFRLGPNPAQNELLAELIKLGAQQGSDFAIDSPNSELSSTCTTTYSTSDEQTPSTSSFCELRPIVIDGSNVAMSHGNKEIFSCRGIKLCVDWFKNRGHKDITVFVPKWRKESSRPENPIKDQDILNELERERLLVFTPSRLVGGKRLVCYDDRYILKLAADTDGIVVSNDNYRDLIQESNEFKKVVEERVLMYSFVNDRFMPPDDPLGRSGPTLDNFLRIQPKKGDPPPPCPYGKKCTYGNKCKFNHPERGSGPHKSVTERLSEYAARHLQARNEGISTRTTIQGKSLSVPLCSSGETSPVGSDIRRKPLSRTKSGAPDLSPTSFASKSTVLESQQKSQLISTSTVQQQLSINHIWDCHNYDCQPFPKSHSIENISREIYSGPTHSSNYTPQWIRQNTTPNPQQNESCENTTDGNNLHRKLHRQLTLNPAGCDPRIYQMQRASLGHNKQSSCSNQAHSSHRPLAPSLSGPRNHHPAHWSDIHQNVTRIASAPDPSRPWQGGLQPASSSEPHINLWPHNCLGAQHQTSQTVTQDQRRRLHYHLASIFPEDQVQTVMQMYPDETNPQKICAAILTMFPKM